jgi:tetratricopeptide (TPR) repeat protein
MKKKGLKQAQILFRKKKFSEVIRYLEPQVFMYRENFSFFYLLGISCLYTKDYGGAHTYLNRAVQLKPEDENTILGLAAIYLRRGKTEEALKLWLEILDSDPGNPTAKRGLHFVKKYAGSDSIPDVSTTGKEERFFPNPPANTPKIIGIISTVLILAGTAFFTYPLLMSRINDNTSRPGENAISDINASDNLVSYEGEYKYFYTEDEINRLLDKIIRYFNEYRDNMVIREANRVLLSNASNLVKEKVHLLLGHITKPDFTSLKDNFSYSEVMTDPELYRGCYVKWKGKISNISGKDAPVRFDLLIGYHTGNVVEGIIGVHLPFAAELNPGESYEILAELAFSDNNKLYLTGIAIHQIYVEQKE